MSTDAAETTSTRYWPPDAPARRRVGHGAADRRRLDEDVVGVGVLAVLEDDARIDWTRAAARCAGAAIRHARGRATSPRAARAAAASVAAATAAGRAPPPIAPSCTARTCCFARRDDVGGGHRGVREAAALVGCDAGARRRGRRDSQDGKDEPDADDHGTDSMEHPDVSPAVTERSRRVAERLSEMPSGGK